ncbi:TldD/PmbA family protein [Granulicella tundricola]|uniref:Peptidase U62 modulator of DNA gyrase n=1 Tax=Granulicella tundricola (strain ATCC BAA-1859 / DSM 23138 / MP5ACTX9) TaxID=1198114 RepID=E8WZV0_GRATM|nr:metallopeptidase TldD-related protein [Granulicella tundricola]ADW67761.1 peptidase U62 modulator of DNA gyrase [Granulicella tundricola MP5ACTX9]
MNKRVAVNRVTQSLLTAFLVGQTAFGASAAASGPDKKPAASGAQDPVLIQTMQAELTRAMSSLGSAAASTAGSPPPPKPYFMSYAVSDAENVSISAQFGAITNSNETRRRNADIQVRLGDYAQDNTHGDHRTSALTTVPLPLTDDREALARSFWFATNRGYGKALDSYLKVKTEQQVRAKEEDASADFSHETTSQEFVPSDAKFSPAAPLMKDKSAWEERLRELSGLFKQFPDIFSNTVALDASNEVDYFIDSDGTRISTPSHVARIVVVARTRAADGMDLFRVETFESDELGRLPDQKTLTEKTLAMAKNLEELRVAPVTEPFDGPAILSGRASAVFFHEVLGHRLEGQRQRGDEEGQTFTKLLNKPILPTFLSVADDPTLKTFDGISLSGHYSFDDEGQPARKVDLIQDGVLKTFLMSRLPIASFSASNGHGRSEAGHMPTGRQGNLIVTSSKSVSEPELREMLKAEAKKQNKPYGLYFEDISSGFAVTSRRSPQAFSVIPLVVYRIYVDGRPDELVRGVSIVGTPQAALSRIVATGNHQDVFNGICGAESGSIPVSAVAPAMLVSEIETQRQAQGSSRPPIVPPPAVAKMSEAGR